MTNRLAISSLLALAFLSTACTTPNNDRLQVGPAGSDDAYVPPAIDPSVPLAPAEAPSVTGLKRDNWEASDYVVHNDGVEHYPHFTGLYPRFDDSQARNTGVSPTPTSSLQNQGDAGAQTLEAIAWPVWVGFDVIMIIPRSVAPEQLSPEPSDPYWRSVAEVE